MSPMNYEKLSKIINLYKNGKSRAEIHEITGVCEASIKYYVKIYDVAVANEPIDHKYYSDKVNKTLITEYLHDCGLEFPADIYREEGTPEETADEDSNIDIDMAYAKLDDIYHRVTGLSCIVSKMAFDAKAIAKGVAIIVKELTGDEIATSDYAFEESYNRLINEGGEV